MSHQRQLKAGENKPVLIQVNEVVAALGLLDRDGLPDLPRGEVPDAEVAIAARRGQLAAAGRESQRVKALCAELKEFASHNLAECKEGNPA